MNQYNLTGFLKKECGDSQVFQ